MGSTIYSQKAKHPVYVSYNCEHCGQYNSFSQELVGVSTAEVRYGSSRKSEAAKLSKLGPGAQDELMKKIQDAAYRTGKNDFSWLKLHKCNSCKYVQSWQTALIWKKMIKFFILDAIILLVFISWWTGATHETISTGTWVTLTICGLFILIPIINLIVSLQKRDKENRNKPDVRI